MENGIEYFKTKPKKKKTRGSYDCRGAAFNKQRESLGDPKRRWYAVAIPRITPLYKLLNGGEGGTVGLAPGPLNLKEQRGAHQN